MTHLEQFKAMLTHARERFKEAVSEDGTIDITIITSLDSFTFSFAKNGEMLCFIPF